jgi:hypothetical protein
MKRILVKILGIIAVTAMIASAQVYSVAADVSGVTVTVSTANGSNFISSTGNYAINFTPGTQLLGPMGSAASDTVTITFPSSFTVGSSITATITAGSGLISSAGTTASQPSVTSHGGSTTKGQTVIFTLGTGDQIGARAQVSINITAGVLNPSIAGNYTLTIATSQEPSAVPSGAFSIVNPSTGGPPGVVSVYNSAGTMMTQYNSLNSALNYVIANNLSGATIKLTNGTFDDLAGAYTASVTLTGTDPSSSNVILKGTAPWSLTGAKVALNTLTVSGSNTDLLTLGGANTTAATITGCNFYGGALTISALGPGATNVISSCNFTVKSGSAGLIPAVAGTTVTNSNFTVAGSGIGINAGVAVTVSGCTFNGAADSSTTETGIGIALTGGSGTNINTSTFTGLAPALSDTTASANFNGNTVTNYGVANTGLYNAIMVTGLPAAPGLYVMNNKITNSPQYIISVNGGAGSDAAVYVMDNNFSGNVKNANNAVAGVKLNVSHNYWGGGANNPASTPSVDYSNPLGAAPTTAAFGTGASGMTLDATANIGVNITASTGATVLGAAVLSFNPVSASIPAHDSVLKFWDIFGAGPNNTAVARANIDFYGTTAAPITPQNSALLMYDSVNNTWTDIHGFVDAAGNRIQITVGSSGNITPAQFTDAIIALVTFPFVGSSPITSFPPLYPANGAINVPIDDVTFNWPQVTGTGITYQFALAKASNNNSVNEFAIVDYTDTTLTNAEPCQETLQPGTVYWWEVRAVILDSGGNVAATGPWSINMFTTGPLTTTTTTTITVTNTNTSTIVESTTTYFTETVGGPPARSDPFPTIMFWVIIGIDTIMVVTIIILTVRTRRSP